MQKLIEENKRLRFEATERRARRAGISTEELKRKNIEENERLKSATVERKQKNIEENKRMHNVALKRRTARQLATKSENHWRRPIESPAPTIDTISFFIVSAAPMSEHNQLSGQYDLLDENEAFGPPGGPTFS